MLRSSVSGSMRIYLDHNATTPPRPAGGRRDRRRSRARSGATRRASTTSASRPRPSWTRRAARSRRCSAATPSEVVFTGRRHRERQLRHPRRGRSARADRPPAPDCHRHRARGRAQHPQGAGAARLAGHAPAGRRQRASSRRTAARRRSPTTRPSCRSCTPTTRSAPIQPIAELAAIAHERGALVHTDAVQTAGKIPIDVRRARRRPAVDLGAQVLRPEGRRGAVGAARRPAAAVRHRRPAGAQPAGRHRERGRHRRPRRRRRPGATRRWPPRRRGSRRCAIGSSSGILAAVRRRRAQRRRRPARAEHHEHQLRAGRIGVAADRPRSRGHRRVVGLGLLVGHARAVARAEGDGTARTPAR